MRAVLSVSLLTLLVLIPASRSVAAGPESARVLPSKTDICKGKVSDSFGGTVDYGKSHTYFWACTSLDTVDAHNSLSEEQGTTKLDPRHRYGYWASLKSVTLKVLKWTTRPAGIEAVFTNKSGKSAKVRLWYSGMY